MHHVHVVLCVQNSGVSFLPLWQARLGSGRHRRSAGLLPVARGCPGEGGPAEAPPSLQALSTHLPPHPACGPSVRPAAARHRLPKAPLTGAILSSGYPFPSHTRHLRFAAVGPHIFHAAQSNFSPAFPGGNVCKACCLPFLPTLAPATPDSFLDPARPIPRLLLLWLP